MPVTRVEFSRLESLAPAPIGTCPLLPIGGNFTMGIDDAVEAVKMLTPRTVIPMHYGTFPLIAVDPQVFRKKVESSTSAHCTVLEPGQTF